MDAKTFVSYMFPADFWTPFAEFFWGAGGTMVTVIVVLVWITFAVYFFSTWYQSYKATGNVAMFPWGVFVILLVLMVILICIALTFGEVSLFGYTLFGMSKCASDHPDKDAGLCYVKCDPGYHGVGPVCWADTISRGAGTPAGLAPCRDGYRTEGLICSSIGWDSCRYKTIIGCIGGFTGDMYGRLDGGGVCPGPSDFGGDLGAYDGNYKNYVNSTDPNKELNVHPEATPLFDNTKPNMCYNKCPDNWTHVNGMPYLCIRKKPGTNEAIPLSYGRGVGLIPHFMQFFDREQVKYVF